MIYGGITMNNEFRCTYKGDIEKVEKKLGFLFPKKFKDYVSTNNGGLIEVKHMSKSGIEEIFSFGSVRQ